MKILSILLLSMALFTVNCSKNPTSSGDVGANRDQNTNRVALAKEGDSTGDSTWSAGCLSLENQISTEKTTLKHYQWDLDDAAVHKLGLEANIEKVNFWIASENQSLIELYATTPDFITPQEDIDRMINQIKNNLRTYHLYLADFENDLPDAGDEVEALEHLVSTQGDYIETLEAEYDRLGC